MKYIKVILLPRVCDACVAMEKSVLLDRGDADADDDEGGETETLLTAIGTADMFD